MLIKRRSLLAASAAATSYFAAKAASAGTFKGDIEKRGTIGRLERLSDMHLEHQQDFLTNFRSWINGDFRVAASQRADAIVKAAGMDPKAEVSYKDAAALFENDPITAGYVRAWVSNQQQTWSSIQDYFHANADEYLSEMEAADKVGPGKVEWDRKMVIPDYTKHEIHIQPGGYVGDEFAGYINFYGVNNFYAGLNFQDETQAAIAKAVILPKDGKVKRILDMGCATGRLTMQMKERFPDAEVWGIDVGAPMVRFAHVRSLDLGLDINYAQQLAESTKFPDGYFDLVVSYIMFHEVTRDAAKQIAKEAHRVLRPGGVFYPVDFQTGKQRAPMTAYNAFSTWWDHRWNNEVWSMEYRDTPFAETLANAGFVVDENIPQARRGHGRIMGTKTA
ncbi:MAG: methyltransferase domain-containing protein [Rhodospirillaceae bacterium]|nr:methyltransferase domain-containing protein [Rhodospirillaceae bacterium]